MTRRTPSGVNLVWSGSDAESVSDATGAGSAVWSGSDAESVSDTAGEGSLDWLR